MSQRPPRPGWFRWSSLLLALGGLLIFMLVLSGLQAGAALLAGSSTLSLRTPGPTATPTGTASLPTATLTTNPTDPDWHTYSYPSEGFRVDIPTVLYPQHSLLINNGTGEQTDWVYQGAALGSPLREAAAETMVRVQYSTTIAETNLCPAGGTPITIGQGVRAYEEANVPPDSNGPAASQPYVRVSLVTGGVAIRIELDGQGAPDAFFSRYGPIWQHMLASFATFAPPQPATTHPCG
jgi:hypothetical protein